jgi:hypothetical protein
MGPNGGATATVATSVAQIHNFTGRLPVLPYEKTGFLEVSARTRGPAPFDAFGRTLVREEVDLTAHLVEQPLTVADFVGGASGYAGATGVYTREQRLRHDGRGQWRAEEIHAETQTDIFAPRPPSPPYMPAKRGVDAATQIVHGQVPPRPTHTAAATAGDSDAEAAALASAVLAAAVDELGVGGVSISHPGSATGSSATATGGLGPDIRIGSLSAAESVVHAVGRRGSRDGQMVGTVISESDPFHGLTAAEARVAGARGGAGGLVTPQSLMAQAVAHRQATLTDGEAEEDGTASRIIRVGGGRRTIEVVTLREGEDYCLWDFDTAVAPLVDSLVEKLLEQALVELRREFELLVLESRKVTAQRMRQEDERRVFEIAKEARATAQKKMELVEAARRRVARELEAMRKVAAYGMARALVATALPRSILPTLRQKHFFRDAIVDSIRAEVMPAVLEEVGLRVELLAVADQAVAQVLSGAADKAQALLRAKEQREREERERKYFIRVFVRVAAEPEPVVAPPKREPEGEEGEEEEEAVPAPRPVKLVMVGPVPVLKADSVATVEANIYAWLLAQKKVFEENGSAAAAGAPPPAEMPLSAAPSNTAIPDPAGPKDIDSVLALAKGGPLCLYVKGSRLPQEDALLSFPFEMLAKLELRAAKRKVDTEA